MYLDLYRQKFRQLPPRLTTVSWNNDFFIELIKEAINRNKPLTLEEVSNKFKGKYDLL